MYSFLTDLFHSALFWGSSMSFCVSVVHSVVLLRSIPLCRYPTTCLSIHLLMHICAVSGFSLLQWQINQLWTFTYNLSVDMFLFLLGKHVGVEWLGRIFGVFTCLKKKLVKPFSEVHILICICSISLPTTGMTDYFSHSSGCVGVSHYHFS